MTPTVSILIPAHNAERWLGATLDSVLAQTHPDLDIIVMDDGSVDSTLSIARDYARRFPDRLRVETQTNAGASSARNHALRLSRGSLVKFIDADDLLSPDAVAIQVAALVGRPRSLAHGEWARFHADPAEARFTPRPGWHDSDSPIDWICETWACTEPMYQCGLFLIPSELLDIAGAWDERLSLIDDFEFFTRLILASEGIVHTPAAKLYYRSGLPGSLSGQKSRRAWESAILSTRLATGHVIARENTPRTRRLAANFLQQLVFSLYPAHPDLHRPLLDEIASLGGSDLLPGGGRAFRLLARIAGWRFALHLRKFLRP